VIREREIRAIRAICVLPFSAGAFVRLTRAAELGRFQRP
jgi:hypothetical protein